MKLSRYNKKRSFDSTPEPTSGKNKTNSLVFVVQKHHASHLHYDFRLEMDGVLKSWAVPKGVSMNPADKRLAMMVEDHPLDYRKFEGIIPKGNYGAGSVIVWDEGNYSPLEDNKDKKVAEKSLLRQLKAGTLKFKLKGEKLKGEFALIKTPKMGENAWLLIKHNDEYATDKDITLLDKSVLTDRGVDELNEKSKTQKPYPKAEKKQDSSSDFTSITMNKLEKASNNNLTKIIKNLPSTPFNVHLSPMLATLTDVPFDDEGWEYEIKWDGYRALTFKNGKNTRLQSRNGKSFQEKFYPVYEALAQWKIDVIMDGEIVTVDKKGISSFSELQNWRSEKDGLLQYYLFDVLWYEGKLLTDLPLSKRMEILRSIVPQGDEVIRIGYSVKGRGKDFFATAKHLGLEGIMAKKVDSPYFPGERSKDWLKIKIQQRQEVVIVGYTHIKDSPKLFSSLLLGVYSKDGWQYVGKVGTGFSDELQKDLVGKFRTLITSKSPFTDIPDPNKPSRFNPSPPKTDIVWLKPKFVCEISFTEVTKDGVFRHPSFKGLRDDKAAKEVVKEKQVPSENRNLKNSRTMPLSTKKEKKDSNNEVHASLPIKQNKVLLDTDDKSQTVKINGHTLELTNLDKLFWSEEKITKRDLLNYYYSIAPFILPYLKDRPQSLYRFPDGYQGKSFYQKDITGKVPGWATTLLYHSEEEKVDKHFLVAKEEASLLYMVNFGCIEINPWSSTIKKKDYPDWCILDLDPGEKTSFNKVIDVANTIHELLEGIGIPSYPKTSGSSGIHVYIPLGKKYTYQQSKEFARVLVTIIHEQTKKYTTLERQVNERKGKLYLDFLQNRPQATHASPYSVRPKPNATVSMPLFWEEVKHGLKMTDFTLRNVPKLLEERGDIFLPVLGKGINMVGALHSLS